MTRNSENSSTSFDNDFECDGADGSRILHSWNHRNLDSGHEGGGRSEELACTVPQSEETVRAMVEREREHFPRVDYLQRLRSGKLDLGVRRDALDWIWKVMVLMFKSSHFHSMSMKNKPFNWVFFIVC